jgi:hypothetical protein
MEYSRITLLWQMPMMICLMDFSMNTYDLM